MKKVVYWACFVGFGILVVFLFLLFVSFVCFNLGFCKDFIICDTYMP